jgi:hypothetical protein
MIFNTVSDDSSITKNYQAVMGISGNKDLPALVSEGVISKTSKETVAGKSYEVYTINRDMLNQKASTLSKSLIDDPENYNYANSIWQDKLGNSVSLREALGERGADNKYKNQEAVLNQIRTHYVDQAIEASGLNKAISAQLPKPEKGYYYKTDKQLRTLAQNPGKTITVFGKKYKIETIDNKQYIIGQEKQLPPPTLDKDGNIIPGSEIPTFDWDKGNNFPLYIVDEKTKKKTLNYNNFRSITGDTTKIKN